MKFTKYFLFSIINSVQSLLSVGGQALIEGVLMKSPNFLAYSIRNDKGKISVKTKPYKSIIKKIKYLNIPILRGGIILFETMMEGIVALNYSANESIGEEDEKLSSIHIFLAVLFSLLFAIVIFKVLPFLSATFIQNTFFTKNSFYLNLMDGIIKFAIFGLYLYFISRFDDVKRIFQYHGAEHKSINCYEHNNGDMKKLIVDNAMIETTMHPRCGTTFVFIVFIISFLIYLLIPLTDSIILNLTIRIALLPIISGISYEYLKISSKYMTKNKFARALTKPGLFFQNFTTSEPDEKQMEVGLLSLIGVLKREEELVKKSNPKKKAKTKIKKSKKH